MREKILLIDGHSMLNRGYYGLPLLTNSKGVHTNAVLGFLNIMFKVINEEQPDYLTVAFDEHAPTFRHEMYEAYKGTRHAMPDELKEQVPLIKEVLSSMGIRIISKSGIEADDIIGTISRIAIRDQKDAVILSGDRDLLMVADAVLRHYPVERDTALLLMGHGSEHFANMIYPAMQTAFRLKGAANVFVGTVEGWPAFEDCLPQLKAFRPARIELAPMMLVAGDHALNDMAGPEDDSWRSRLRAESFTVECHTEGIGMWDEICGMYIDHARAALDMQASS